MFYGSQSNVFVLFSKWGKFVAAVMLAGSVDHNGVAGEETLATLWIATAPST